jgi:CheY-like chemotaxis protein
VDDIQENRKFVSDILGIKEIHTEECDSAESALEILKTSKPDLIITDIMMPRMDGYEFLAKVREIPELKGIPVFAYTAAVMTEELEKIERCEFSGVLFKPLDIKTLIKELMHFLPYSISEIDHAVNGSAWRDGTGEITDIEGLQSALRGEFYDMWLNFKSRQPINEIRKFGNLLRDLGIRHQHQYLEQYGAELVRSADTFAIENILKLLDDYEMLLKT